MFVPIAPSYTTTRRSMACRYGDLVRASLIFVLMPLVAEKGQIKKPKRERRASALAKCLTWPQVALNRHGLQLCPFTIVVPCTAGCKRRAQSPAWVKGDPSSEWAVGQL